MFLIDFSQVCISSLMAQTGGKPDKLDENLVRHMILNTLRSFITKNKAIYGTPIVCCDSRHFWRRDVFPHYKHHRRKDRDDSGLNWTEIFTVLNKIKEELKEFFPYKVIEVHGAEADDIIGVLVEQYADKEPILILSSDKDFLQLQRYKSVKQFSNIEAKWITTENPEAFLIEHIIKGDRGDGIPNILSPDDVFVKVGGRQKPLNSKKVQEWVGDYRTIPHDETLRGFKRNSKLIDLRETPEDLKLAIIKACDDCRVGSRKALLDYFIEKRLTNMIGAIGEF